MKYGIISDEKFAEKAKEFVLLKNTEGKFFTLDEYKEKVAPIQTDKDKQLVYIYASDAGKQDSFIQAAKNKGYDVLLLDGVLDSHFISNLAKIRRLNSSVWIAIPSINSSPPMHKAESVLSKEEEESVKGVFEKAINNKNMTLAVEALSPDDLR